MDTAAARYTLSLMRWWIDPDSDTCEPCPQPPRLYLHVRHKTEIAEISDPYEGDLPLSLCAALSPGEMVELVEAQRRVLARCGGGVSDTAAPGTPESSAGASVDRE